MARGKYWNGYHIGAVMRSLWQAGWDSTKITTFFVKSGINVSTNTVNTERHKLKTGATPASLTQADWDQINETMEGKYTKKKDLAEELYGEDDNDEQGDEEKPQKPIPTVDLSKLTQLITLFKETLESKLDVLEAKLLDQDEKVRQIEDIALATSKKIHVTLPDGVELELNEAMHPALPEVLTMVQGIEINKVRERINVVLIGPAGSGKTFLAGQVARILKTRFDFISCSGGMSEGHVLGRLIPIGSDGAFTYVPTKFVEIYENGGVFLFDEMDAADSNMMIVLNAALDGKKLAIPNRHKKPYAEKHEDCIIMGACNTFGTGADRMYVGRNQQDEAFLDRFRAGQVELDYDPALEAKLCPDSDLRERIQGYRDNCRKSQVRRVISSRFLKQAYMLKKMGLDHRVDKALFGGWRPEEISKAKGGY